MATIIKRGKSYKITVSCGYDINKVQIRKHLTWIPEDGMTEKQINKELNRQAVLFEEKCKKGLVIDSNIKLIDFEELYFRNYAKTNLRKRSYARYSGLRSRVDKALGHMRMDKIQPHHILSFYANLSEPGVREDTKYKCKIDFVSLLKKKQLSQEKAAKIAGLSTSTIKSVCKEGNVSKQSAEKIVLSFDLKFDEAFTAINKDATLENTTILYYHHFLSSIFSVAVQWQVILNNPCSRVKPPKVDKKEPRYWDDKTAVEMLACLSSEPIKYRALIILYLFMGYRRGEALGLRWKDIDFINELIDIGWALSYLPGLGVYLDDTKNDPSQRVSKAPPIVFQTLKEYKAWQNEQRLKIGDQWDNKNDLVFTTWNGEPMHPDTISHWFKEFVFRNELPDLSLHGLRHTNASLQIAHNVPITTVAQRLGHANASTTAKIYAHAIRSADAAAAEVIEDVLNSKTTNTK